MLQPFYLVPALVMIVFLGIVFPQGWRRDASPVWLKCLWLAACVLFAGHYILKAFDERGHESSLSSVIDWLSFGVFMLAVTVTVRRQKSTKQKP